MLRLQNTLVTTLRAAFNYTNNHRVPKDQFHLSKKWGALYLANTLFSIFYRADQLRQCKFFISAVESPVFPPLESFPLSQVCIAIKYKNETHVCT